MSSAHGEAEHGHALSVSDDDDEEGGEEVGLHSRIDDRAQGSVQASVTTFASGPNGDRDRSEEEDSLTIDGNSFSRNGADRSEKEPIQPNSSGLRSAEVETPSSADGSLSIPDDTPSVQVCTNVENLVDGCLSSIPGLDGIIPR